MTQLLNLIDDNLITSNSRALFRRSGSSASTAVGSFFEFADVSGTGAYNKGSGFTITTSSRVTCEFDGEVSIHGVLQGTSVATQQGSLWKNGVFVTALGRNSGTSTNLTLAGDVGVSKGDYLEVKNDGSGSVAIDGNGSLSFTRVSSTSAGAVVGFGTVNQGSSGLQRQISDGSSAAAALSVGEVISVNLGPTTPTNAVATELGNISITPGHWLLRGACNISNNTGNGEACMEISTSSASVTVSNAQVQAGRSGCIPSVDRGDGNRRGYMHLSSELLLAATTTYYFNVVTQFNACQFVGYFEAIRIR